MTPDAHFRQGIAHLARRRGPDSRFAHASDDLRAGGRSPGHRQSESHVTVTHGVGGFKTGHLFCVTSSPAIDRSSARPSSASWWFRSSDGQLALWQRPNPALCVWLVTLAVGRLDLSTTHATAVAGVRHGALLVWALDEVVRGASPFRRVLGAVTLAAQLVMLALG